MQIPGNPYQFPDVILRLQKCISSMRRLRARPSRVSLVFFSCDLQSAVVSCSIVFPVTKAAVLQSTRSSLQERYRLKEICQDRSPAHSNQRFSPPPK